MSGGLFPVTLIDFLFFRDQGRSGNVELRFDLALPFVPAPGIELGLLPQSDFNCDADVIDRVLFHVPSGRFFVRLRPQGDLESESLFWKTVGHQLKNGWRFEPDYPQETAKDADDFDRGAYFVVEHAGKFYPLNETEVKVMALANMPHRVVKEPAVKRRAAR